MGNNILGSTSGRTADKASGSYRHKAKTAAYQSPGSRTTNGTTGRAGGDISERCFALGHRTDTTGDRANETAGNRTHDNRWQFSVRVFVFDRIIFGIAVPVGGGD